MVAAGELASLGLEPVAENLLRDPIEYLRADIFRHRKLCDLLDAMRLHPEDRDSALRAEVVLNYLESDLPRHLEDAWDELLPRLKRRADGDGSMDGIEEAAGQDRDGIRNTAASLAAVLKPLAGSGHLAANGEILGVIQDFIVEQQRLLAWEQEVLLPLAKRLLAAEDLAEMGRNMADRRGVPYPE